MDDTITALQTVPLLHWQHNGIAVPCFACFMLKMIAVLVLRKGDAVARLKRARAHFAVGIDALDNGF